MGFLHERVFDPILQSTVASEKLWTLPRLTIMRMEQRDALPPPGLTTAPRNRA
jgi:hypothetical protein